MFEKVLEEIIRNIFVSEDMQQYLRRNIKNLKKWQIIEMVCGAPISLSKKRRIFKELSEYECVENEEQIDEETFRYYFHEIDKAFDELCVYGDQNGILLLNEYVRFGEDVYFSDSVPFTNYGKLVEHLESCRDEWESKQDFVYYIIDKYAVNINGNFEETYSFVFLNGELTYFGYFVENFYKSEFWGSRDLNLPVPWKLGDIITIPVTPFSEKRTALILEIGDNWDCCSVQVMYVTEDGDIEEGALKHADQLHDGKKLLISPLYSAKKYTEKLTGKNELLRNIQFVLKSCETRVKRDLHYQEENLRSGF